MSRVTLTILDEADKMLEMGFEDQVLSIMNSIRKERQTLLFSATFKSRVRRVADSIMRSDNKIVCEIGRAGTSSANVSQIVHCFANYNGKKSWLMKTLPSLVMAGRTIVFVGTRHNTEELANDFLHSTFKVDSIHGDKSQLAREESIKKFKRSEIQVLFATDVASRGLDIDNIACVVNFDVAKNYDSHCHRVGRAGRLSKDAGGVNVGMAHTLIIESDRRFAEILYDAFLREGRLVGDDLARFISNSGNNDNYYGDNKNSSRNS